MDILLLATGHIPNCWKRLLLQFRPEVICKDEKSRDGWKVRREEKNVVDIDIELELGDQLSMRKKSGITMRF